MSHSRVLITAALPYANGPLHFGHIAGAYLPADVYARFCRLLGKDVLYICGSDEYGIAITLNAERMNMGYQDYVDMYHKMHKETFARLGISFDFFSRTTNPYHKDIVQAFYSQLKANGYIENHISDQLYSEEEDRFLADRYVEGTCPKCGFERARGDECLKCGAEYEATDLLHPKSKISGASLVLKKTEHSYLHLERLIEPLLEFVGVLELRDHMRKFVTDYVKNLRPRAITRDLSWGISVPDMDKKVFYVWFDAPIGYISATKDWAHSISSPDAWRPYWLQEDTYYVQFVGKDNVPFHAVIFPAMELGQDIAYKKVDSLISSEFYLLEGAQFSKSEGNFIDIEEFLQEHSVDKLRYVLSATSPETSDSEFTLEDFKARCNADLVGKFGNFINRVLAFAEKNGFTTLPFVAERLHESDITFLEGIRRLVAEMQEHYAHFSLRQATSTLMELASLGNAYFNDQAPWKLIKSGDRDRVATILFCSCYCQKVLALCAYPIMPGTACKIWKMLSPNTHGSCLEDRAQNLWSEEFLNPQNASFSLSSPELLFSIID